MASATGFNASKTKATVTGSKIYMQYFKDIKMWTMYDEKIEATEDNEHLVLIVSGQDEEAQNVHPIVQDISLHHAWTCILLQV
jgi:hypothetical protein